VTSTACPDDNAWATKAPAGRTCRLPRRIAHHWSRLGPTPLRFSGGHNFSRFDRRRHADLANPTLIRARQASRASAASRGWGRWVARDVDRALVVLLSNHAGDDKIRYTELTPALRHHGLTIERTVEVLTDLGLFHDDKTPAFDKWLDRKLEPLNPGIRHDVQTWLRLLHDGGPRAPARNPETAWSYLNQIRPLLLHRSNHHGHLREVTRQDILDATDTLHGSNRHITLSVLRSLFRHCKKTGAIFRDPTTRIRPNRVEYTAILPVNCCQVISDPFSVVSRKPIVDLCEGLQCVTAGSLRGCAVGPRRTRP
jgi:hypothetical protein